MSDSVWPHRQQPTRLPHPWDSPGKNTVVGCHFLLQYINTNPKYSKNLRGKIKLLKESKKYEQFLCNIGVKEAFLWFKVQKQIRGIAIFTTEKSDGKKHSQSCCMLSCLQLFCDPTDCSHPDSSVHGIFHARILGWVAISSSMGSSWSRDPTPVSGGSWIGRRILYHWVT